MVMTTLGRFDTLCQWWWPHYRPIWYPVSMVMTTLGRFDTLCQYSWSAKSYPVQRHVPITFNNGGAPPPPRVLPLVTRPEYKHQDVQKGNSSNNNKLSRCYCDIALNATSNGWQHLNWIYFDSVSWKSTTAIGYKLLLSQCQWFYGNAAPWRFVWICPKALLCQNPTIKISNFKRRRCKKKIIINE